MTDQILSDPNGDKGRTARSELNESLMGVASIFVELPYFMSDDYTLVDCCLAPMLWRLPQFGLEIQESSQTKPLLEYMERVFSRDAFQQSLTDLEREIHG